MITPSDQGNRDNEVLSEDETDYSFPAGKEFIPHNID